MINYPLINAPNDTVLLDFSAYDTENYAGSEIFVPVLSQNNTLVLPPCSKVKGFPSIYVNKRLGLKVQCDNDDVFSVGTFPSREIKLDENPEILILEFKKVIYAASNPYGVQGVWMVKV